MAIDTETPVAPSRWRRLAPRKRGEAEDGTSPTPTPPPPALPGRRNPRWIALGVVALCLGALISYVVYSRVADQSAVVVLTRTVHRGEVVRAADLRTVSLGATPGIQTVPGSQLSQLVGRRAAYDLVGGALLPAGAVSDALLPTTGRSVVGVRLVSGRAPVGLLVPGSPVRLVAIPPSGAEPAFKDQYSGTTVIAREVSEEVGADGASVVVNVDVPANQAPTVALLAAQERLALVRDADR